MRYRGRFLFGTEHIQFHEEGLWYRIAEDMLREIRRAGLECDFRDLASPVASRYGVSVEDISPLIDLFVANNYLEDVERVGFRTLDLSLTNWCNARCIYCATPRVRRARRVLRQEQARKILLDLVDPAFTERYGRLVCVEIGGTTEPLLNPEVLDILRVLKEVCPTRDVTLYTNGVMLLPALSEAILSERLVTSLVISIDGVSAAEHAASKGISYRRVQGNLNAFLAARQRLSAACGVQINVMTYRRYCSSVQAALGRNPLAVAAIDSSLEDSTAAIIATWRPLLDESDVITPAVFQLRGEYKSDRDEYPVAEEDLPCPWIGYVIHSINIAANGDWFTCCNDFFQESVLGNVLSERVRDVAVRARDPFVRALVGNHRAVLPARCLNRKYCQFLP